MFHGLGNESSDALVPSSSNRSSTSSLFAVQEPGSFKIDRLPVVVFSEIMQYFKYDELTSLRLVNTFFKRNVERRLNETFFRLGRELSDLEVVLKRRLPRKESERK
jgi:hypothetical protein